VDLHGDTQHTHMFFGSLTDPLRRYYGSIKVLLKRFQRGIKALHTSLFLLFSYGMVFFFLILENGTNSCSE
jgi:hypothetical protein